MTQPVRQNYEMAGEKVQSGTWRVDAELGLVYGTKGQPFRRLNSWGYVQIKFRDPADWRRARAVLAHRVVWEAVHGPLLPGLTINHINGDKTDNRLVNLEAVTQAENQRHAIRTGLNVPLAGSAKPNALLNDEDVREVYARAWAGENQTSIANVFGVSREVVSNIKCGWSWSHITGHVRTEVA